MDAGPGPGVTNVGHCFEPNGTAGGRNGAIPLFWVSETIASRLLEAASEVAYGSLRLEYMQALGSAFSRNRWTRT